MFSERLVAGRSPDTVVATTTPDDIRSAVTRYPVIGDPPVAVGAVQLAVASIGPPAVPSVAVPITGARGTVTDVTAADRAESGPVPAALVAATAKVYAVPLVSPVTTRLVAPAAAVWLRSTVVPVPL